MVSKRFITFAVSTCLVGGFGVSEFAPVLAAQIVVAQDVPKSIQQTEVSTAKAGKTVPLDIYNFALGEGAKTSETSQALTEAIADALFLQFVGQPGLDVRRIRESYKPAATPPAAESPEHNSGETRASERPPRYILEGNVVFEEVHGGMELPSADQGSSTTTLFVMYRLHGPAENAAAKSLLEGSVGTQLAYLSASLRQISDRAVAKLVPVQKIRIRISDLQLQGFPANRKSFYAENLPDLMSSELLSQDFIALADTGGKPDYTITELATLRAESYELLATISSSGTGEKVPLKETGRETEMLAGQLRLARKLVEALKTRKDLPNQPTELSAEAYVHEADAYLKKNLNVSISLYRKALEIDSSNVETNFSLAWAYLRNSQSEDALKLLQGKAAEDSAHGQYFRSIAFSNLNDKDNAMAAANRAVELASPESPENQARCYSWRATLFTAQGDSIKALSDLETALKLDPKDADRYEDVAKADEKLGKYYEAAVVLDTGRKRTAERERLTSVLNATRRRAAAHFLESNEAQVSLHFALEAVNEDPNSEQGQRLLGTAYHRLRMFPEAEGALNEALTLKETPETLAEMASLRLDEGKKDLAYALAKKSIDTDPERSQAYDTLVHSVGDENLARQTVTYLREIWKAHPHSYGALESWNFLQLVYLINDQPGLNALYAESDAVLQKIAYKDWIDGWTNMVELAVVSGRADKAAAIAQGLLELKPSLDYSLPLVFYLWLIRMVQADCVRAQTEWLSFVGYLGQPQADGLSLYFNFSGTRQFIKQTAQVGTISGSTLVKAESAMRLLEVPTLQRAQIDRFLASFPPGNGAPCPPNQAPVKPAN